MPQNRFKYLWLHSCFYGSGRECVPEYMACNPWELISSFMDPLRCPVNLCLYAFPADRITVFIAEQVLIAQTLHVSTDSILGIKAIEQPETTQEISLADICAKLFELDNLASISFGACKNCQYEEPQNPYEDSIALESPCIFFKNKSITDFIAEWNEIKKINVQSKSVKKSLYTNWKNGTITENKSRLAKYDFKEKRLYQKELAKSYLSDYGHYSYGLPFLLPDDEDLLTEYVRSGDYILDFDEDSQKKLLNWLGYITHESI